MFTQRGMSSGLIIGIVVVLLLLGGGWYYMNSSQSTDTSSDDAMMEEDKDGVMLEGGLEVKADAMMEGDHEGDDAMMMKSEDEAAMKGETSFRSAVIAGSSSPLLEFDQRDYEAALDSDRVVVLYFYANWCPLCRAEFMDTKAAFNALTDDSVIGFRVHFNDGDVTPEMTALAREFGVAYQHTKVFIKNGERVLKSPETWSQERYLTEFKNYVN